MNKCLLLVSLPSILVWGFLMSVSSLIFFVVYLILLFLWYKECDLAFKYISNAFLFALIILAGLEIATIGTILSYYGFYVWSILVLIPSIPIWPCLLKKEESSEEIYKLFIEES